MYYIEVKFYSEPNFRGAYQYGHFIINKDRELESRPRKEDIAKFKTEREAKDWFRANWDKPEIEFDCEDEDAQGGVRYILRNEEKPACYEVIAEGEIVRSFTSNIYC